MKIDQLSDIKSYLYAGKLLHIIALGELILIFIIVPYISKQEVSSWILIGLKYYAIAFFISLPIFSQLDARSRFQNYKQIKDQLYFYGLDKRIFNPTLKSRCQRDAALLAAQELEYGKMCKKYFRSFGYRWYHLTPDFLFKKPQFLLSKYFWKTTFFTPTYNRKVKFYEKQTSSLSKHKYFCSDAKCTTC